MKSTYTWVIRMPTANWKNRSFGNAGNQNVLVDTPLTPDANGMEFGEDGEVFYESLVLTRDKIKQRLRKNEEILWIVGVNKYRHET